MTTFPSIHEIAEELRNVDENLKNVVDDFACLKAYFNANRKTITEDGIKVSDKTPGFADMCSFLHTKMIAETKKLIAAFDSALNAFTAKLAILKETNEAVAKIAESEVSLKVKTMKKMSSCFRDIQSRIITDIRMNNATQEGYLKIIEIMKLMSNDKITDVKDVGEAFKETFLLYQTIPKKEKDELKADFVNLLGMFFKIFAIMRCPIDRWHNILPMRRLPQRIPSHANHPLPRH